MKINLFLSTLFIFLILNCEKGDLTDSDPIVGNWQLIIKKVDNTQVELTNCLAQNTLQFLIERNSIDNKVIFNNYYTDEETDDCLSSIETEYWTRGNSGYYGVHNESLFNQNRSFRIINSRLYYAIDGWDFTDDGIEVTEFVYIYEKL
ncbi:hypothetical protein [Winogradskyella sp. R77965]|uniref:hypothetical protein n=1 Tax=Winogradskyella sp. R77965 TaxID=3093872 RepID=UPI0037DCB7DE